MRTIAVLLCLALCLPAFAADRPAMEEARWSLSTENHRFERHGGAAALFLDNGVAVLNDYEFRNGVIEFDVMFPKQRGFVGVQFRRQEGENYEDFYIRTHQSGNPDANQYTPVFNGLAGWQIFYGPQYSTPVEYVYDKWVHVKLAVLGDEAAMYIDSGEPILRVSDLKRDEASGGIAFWTNFTSAYFANLEITKTDDLTLEGEAAPAHETPDGLVRRWRVSSPFSHAVTAGMTTLDPKFVSDLSWSPLEVETNGVANLARVTKGSRGSNTVLVRLVIDSDKKQLKRFRFGFSDRVRVYLNSDIIFDGNDTYATRDYRHLGTVGFYDAVYLPLKKGRNEIDLAVSESFGGWAAAGAFEDMSDVRIVSDDQ